MNDETRKTSNAAVRGATRQAFAMETLLLAVPPSLIAEFKAIIESYDNLATMRTEYPRLHLVKLYFAAESAAEVTALIDSLSARFSLRRIEPPWPV